MKHIGIVIGIMLFISSTLMHATPSAAMDMTQIGVSASTIALGGSYVSARSAHAIFINPALLSNRLNWSADVFQTQTVQDTLIQNISISKSIRRLVIGAGYSRAGMTDIGKTTLETSGLSERIVAASGTYGYMHQTVYAGTSMQLSKPLRVGVSGKWVSSEIDTITGSGMNADVGIHWVRPTYRVVFGIQNVLRQSKLNYSGPVEFESESMSLTGTLSASKQIDINWIKSEIHLQTIQSRNQPVLLSGGLSLMSYRFPFIEWLMGVRMVPHLDQTLLKKTAGLNLTIKGLSLSYAFEFSGDAYYQQFHYVSFSLFRSVSSDEKWNQRLQELQTELKVLKTKYKKHLKTIKDTDRQLTRLEKKYIKQTQSTLIKKQQLEREIQTLKRIIDGKGTGVVGTDAMLSVAQNVATIQNVFVEKEQSMQAIIDDLMTTGLRLNKTQSQLNKSISKSNSKIKKTTKLRQKTILKRNKFRAKVSKNPSSDQHVQKIKLMNTRISELEQRISRETQIRDNQRSQREEIDAQIQTNADEIQTAKQELNKHTTGKLILKKKYKQLLKFQKSGKQLKNIDLTQSEVGTIALRIREFRKLQSQLESKLVSSRVEINTMKNAREESRNQFQELKATLEKAEKKYKLFRDQ
jgi:chromosome segregation ATPase